MIFHKMLLIRQSECQPIRSLVDNSFVIESLCRKNGHLRLLHNVQKTNMYMYYNKLHVYVLFITDRLISSYLNCCNMSGRVHVSLVSSVF